MIWARKLIVSLFASLAVVALVGGIVVFSINRAVATPDNLQQWLSQSHLYDSFITNTATLASQNNSASTDPNVVQQAIQTAFPEQLISESVATFLNANYDWLQGKTAAPQFTIDLSTAKNNFAREIGNSTAAGLAQLPVCSSAQPTQPQSGAIPGCRNPDFNQQATAEAIAQQTLATPGFLDNPILTADNLRPAGPEQSKPYFQQLSVAPRVYQAAQKAPYVLAALLLVCFAIIFWAAPTRRRAWWTVLSILIFAGAGLVAAKYLAETGFNRGQQAVFGSQQSGQLQQSLIDFAHRATNAVTASTFVAGLACLALALLIIIGLSIARVRRHRALLTTDRVAAAPVETAPTPAVTPVNETNAVNEPAAPFRKPRRVMDVTGPVAFAANKPESPIATPVKTTPGSEPQDGRPHSLGKRGTIQ